MRAAAALVALVAVGILAGRAFAQVPVPTVPTITVPVPVPTVPVPLPATPQLPAATVPTNTAPTSAVTSAVTTAVATVQTPLAGAAVAGSGSSSPSSSSSSSQHLSSSGSSGRTSRSSRVKHFNSSRTWIAVDGSKRRRTTTLTFVLPRAARVVFTVRQVWPVCRSVGRFIVAGRAGLNRVRFAGRVHGRKLTPGTYRISARTRSGRLVQRVTLVVVEVAAPSREELTAARALNACASERDTASAETLAGDGVGSALVQRFAPREQPSAPGAGPAGGGTAAHPGGVLASTVEKTAHAVRPFLVGLLVAAILLLGLAALPRVAVPDPRINDLLARYRIEIAGAGAAALAAAAIAFLIG